MAAKAMTFGANTVNPDVQRLRAQIRAITEERDKLESAMQGEIADLQRQVSELTRKLKLGGPRAGVEDKPTSAFSKDQTCIVELGRYGDIINILPICRDIYAKTGSKVVVAVSRGFEDIFEATTYAEAMPLDLSTVDVVPAIRAAKDNFQSVIVSQVYGKGYNPGKETKHYNIESWRLAGYLDRWDDPSLRLVLDARNYARERSLIERVWPVTDKPIILVNASAGHSSPFADNEAFQKWMAESFSDRAHFIDIGALKAERIYDLVGLFELADGLVTIDTATLHLAAATRIPVIALLSDGGEWRRSAPRCSVVASFPTNEWKESRDLVVSGIERMIASSLESVVLHAYEVHDTSDRAKRAQQTWASTGWTPAPYEKYLRTAKDIGDRRDLPYLKDVLSNALASASDGDIVVFTNDDIILHPDCAVELERLMSKVTCASSRRIDLKDPFDSSRSREDYAKLDNRHVGRDLFAFRADWLRDHISEIPDFILGASAWDLCLAAMVRNYGGCEWSIRTSASDCLSCELPLGLVLHESHSPKWGDSDNQNSPSELHNAKLFKDWCKAYAPHVFMPSFRTV